jgi:hypothetical protein
MISITSEFYVCHDHYGAAFYTENCRKDRTTYIDNPVKSTKLRSSLLHTSLLGDHFIPCDNSWLHNEPLWGIRHGANAGTVQQAAGSLWSGLRIF